MKNFTKQNLNNTLFKSTRWILLALMFLLGTGSAWAATIYYDNSNTKWSKIVMCVGKSDWSQMNFSMTHVCGDIYKATVTGWSDATEISFFDGSNTSGWGSESGSISHRYGWLNVPTKNSVSQLTKALSIKSGNNTGVSLADNKVYKAKTSTVSISTGNGTKTGYDVAYSAVYSDALCCSAPTSVSIARSDAPSTANICQGSTIDLTANVDGGSGDITYVWENTSDGSDWTIANASAQKCTVTAGTGSATFKITATRCSTAKTATITLTADPKSALTLKANPTICQGSSIVLSNYVNSSTGTVKWYSNSARTTEITNPSVARTPQSSRTSYYARATSGVCSSVDKTLTVTLSPQPAITLTSSTATICNGDEITLANYVKSSTGTVKWYTNEGMTDEAAAKVKPTANTTYYYAKATSGDCTPATAQLTVTVNDKPATPTLTPESIVLTSGSATLTVSNPVLGATYTLYKDGESTGQKDIQFTITSQGVYKVLGSNDCGNSSFSAGVLACAKIDAPTFEAKSMTICEGEPFDLPTPNNLKDGEECAWSINGRPTPGRQSGISITTTYQAVKSNDIGCKSDVTEFVVNVIKTPTITGATYTQPGKSNAIELTLPAGISAKWSVSPAADLSVGEGNSTMFSAEANGTYTITADNKGCTDTHVVTVSDAFYVYMRQPKEGETAYGQFYFPTQNPTQGGDLFYKEYASIPPAEGYTDYNKGGVAHDKIFTDCDGYVWYGFRASDKLIDGTNYFTVHALNEGGYDGYYTHTYLTRPGKMTSDIYYTMNENASGVSQGWYITKVDAPYAGPVVHASGNDFSFNKNNFADFVALYVTDCSGKEIDSYQWQYSETENGKYNNYSSVCTYVGKKTESGDAGKSNNIRPNAAGWYRCTATYTDGSSLTSAAKQVTATSGTTYSFTSDLPIIMVNTNGYGFPVNNTCHTPSSQADDMKAKISVDVKIKLGNDIVYDRKARMNYRGSSSLNFVKKSYAFCPGKANCEEDKGRPDYVKTEKLNMLNVGSAVDKDWVLYAAAADPSLMRNRLMFDTFRDMTGDWSVNSRYVELIVDGVYKGVYVFMDKITNNENRVDIDDSKGGFILKFDKTDLVDRYEADGDKKTFKSLYSGYDGESGNGMKTYDTYIDQRFEIEYPEMEDVEDANPGMWAKTVSDIKALINNFEYNLKAGNYGEVQKIIDYTSFADWFIISEYAKNMDAYRASCLFVYDGNKLAARPLWDQELSFSNTCANLCDDYSCNSTEGLLIENSTIYTEGCAPPFWFTGKYVGGRGTEAGNDAEFDGYLLNDPCFIAVLKERWALHTATGGALTKDVLGAKISTYEADLGAIGTTGTPLNREKNFWSGKSRSDVDKSSTGDNCFDGTTGYVAFNTQTTIGNSATSMKNWVNGANGDRRTKLGALIEAMEGSPLSILFSPDNIVTTPWAPISIEVVNPTSYDYTITYTDGELDKQSGVIIERNGDTFKYNVPRPEAWGVGDDVEGKRDDITYVVKATLNVASGTGSCGKTEVPTAEATITLQDEEDENCVQP